jgi:hypothetical protein
VSSTFSLCRPVTNINERPVQHATASSLYLPTKVV